MGIIATNGIFGVQSSSGGGSSYADGNVDTHLNVSGAGSNEVLSWNGSDYAWVAQAGGTYTPTLRYARLTLSGDFRCGGSWAAVDTFNTRDKDTSTSNALTATLADGKLIIPANVDKIRIRASLSSDNTGNTLDAKIYKNGTDALEQTSHSKTDGTDGADQAYVTTPVLDVSQNDYFQVYVKSGSGSKDIVADVRTWFEIEVLEGSMLTTTI